MLVAEAAVVSHALICNGLHQRNLQSAGSQQVCVPRNASRVDPCLLHEATVSECIHDGAQAAAKHGQAAIAHGQPSHGQAAEGQKHPVKGHLSGD